MTDCTRLGECLGEGVWWNRHRNGTQNMEEAYAGLCVKCLDMVTDPSYCWDGDCQMCCLLAMIDHIAHNHITGKSLYYLMRTVEGMSPKWKPGDPNPGHDDELNRAHWNRVESNFPQFVAEKYS
jgi:hypothetical protein